MSAQVSDRDAICQVQQYRAALYVRRGIERFFHSAVLTPQELEHLERKTIREMWIDAKGEKHVRRF